MPKKSKEVTVPMSEELEQMVVEPLEFGDSKSGLGQLLNYRRRLNADV